MFRVNYANQAKQFLKKADNILRKRIFKKITELQAKPVLHDSKTIEGTKELLYRVRVGGFRILYEVNHKGKCIGIVKIDKRGKAYR
jgi:mRNA interferase RelE/StbE